MLLFDGPNQDRHGYVVLLDFIAVIGDCTHASGAGMVMDLSSSHNLHLLNVFTGNR